MNGFFFKMKNLFWKNQLKKILDMILVNQPNKLQRFLSKVWKSFQAKKEMKTTTTTTKWCSFGQTHTLDKSKFKIHCLSLFILFLVFFSFFWFKSNHKIWQQKSWECEKKNFFKSKISIFVYLFFLFLLGFLFEFRFVEMMKRE